MIGIAKVLIDDVTFLELMPDFTIFLTLAKYSFFVLSLR